MRKTSLDCVFELAKKDKRVLFIGSDLGPGVLENFKKEIPSQFLMEGVAEQFIIGMSAGLAKEGFIPYVNTIATFLTRRCYEQVAIDLCLHDLPVRLIGNGGGLVYAPLGPTHLALEDISLMKSLPNMTIISPCDAKEMHAMMHQTLNYMHPIYIRLGRGGEKIVTDQSNKIKIGKGVVFKKGKDALIISTGTMTQKALEVSEEIIQNKIDCGILHLNTIKPLDIESIIENSKDKKLIITIEEHYKTGGLGSSILEVINENLGKNSPEIMRIGVENKFLDEYGNQDTLQRSVGLETNNIKRKILNFFKI